MVVVAREGGRDTAPGTLGMARSWAVLPCGLERRERGKGEREGRREGEREGRRQAGRDGRRRREEEWR